jgi:hypothetical protein
MTKEQQIAAAEALRFIANEIERGEWGSVQWEIVNDLRDKPRMSWEQHRGMALVGRTMRVDLALPVPESRRR